MIDQVKLGRNVLVTRSFSKIYALAGLRIGYAVANENIVRRLDAHRISIPNQAGLAAARASFGDAAFCSDMRTKINEGKSNATRLFQDLGLRCAPSQANFMMFDSGRDNLEFIGFAHRRGVMIAEVADPFSTWVRVSIGRPDDMRAFADALRSFVRST
jgi:histidinol-phosphate aminotransferase